MELVKQHRVYLRNSLVLKILRRARHDAGILLQGGGVEVCAKTNLISSLPSFSTLRLTDTSLYFSKKRSYASKLDRPTHVEV
jgi:hypothetical protein